MSEDVTGMIQLEFVDWQQRRPAREILAEVRERTSGLAGLVIEVREQEAGPPFGKAVQIELSSRYPELLPAAVALVRQGLHDIGGLLSRRGSDRQFRHPRGGTPHRDRQSQRRAPRAEGEG